MPLSRLVLRVIASAISAGAIAFGSTLAAALVEGGQITERVRWIIVAAVVGAIGKDIQASLSRSPGQGEAYAGRTTPP